MKINLRNSLFNKNTSSLEYLFGRFDGQLSRVVISVVNMSDDDGEFNVACADWLYERGLLEMNDKPKGCKANERAVLYFQSKKHKTADASLMRAFARFGSLDKIELMCARGITPTQSIIDEVVAEGVLQKDTLTYLFENYGLCVSEACFDKLLANNAECARWLLTNGMGDCSRDFIVTLTHDRRAPEFLFSMLLLLSANTKRSLYEEPGCLLRRKLVADYVTFRGFSCRV